MGQNLTIRSGSHWIEADCLSYLTRFKMIFVDFGNNGTSDSNLVRNVNRIVSILTIHFMLKDQSKLGSGDLRLKLLWAILPQQWNAIKLIQLEPHKLQFSGHAKEDIKLIWSEQNQTFFWGIKMESFFFSQMVHSPQEKQGNWKTGLLIFKNSGRIQC